MAMRKNIAAALLCLGMMAVGTYAQADRTTRPRVAPTATPPTIRNDSPNRDSTNKPPILIGDQKKPAPSSQIPAQKTNEEDDIVKVETNLVTMPVSVLDREGRFISGLKQSDFRIFENGVEQKIDYFQSVEQPFTVILMIDVSPSTQWQIEEIQQAAITFINQLRSDDRVMVIAFDDSVQILSPITNNRRVLQDAVRRARFGDGTGLYEAVDHVLSRELPQIQGRKAVVLFTDGVDTTSKHANYQSTVKEAEEADALFYPIRYDTSRDMNAGGPVPNYPPRRSGRVTLGDILGAIITGGNMPGGGYPRGRTGQSSAEYETGRKYLETLAQNSGGRKFEADSLTNLDAVFSGIAEELRRQYSLGYYPETVGKRGERKQISVRVMRPGVVVRSKNSYIVGQNENRLAGK